MYGIPRISIRATISVKNTNVVFFINLSKVTVNIISFFYEFVINVMCIMYIDVNVII